MKTVHTQKYWWISRHFDKVKNLDIRDDAVCDFIRTETVNLYSEMIDPIDS